MRHCKALLGPIGPYGVPVNRTELQTFQEYSGGVPPTLGVVGQSSTYSRSKRVELCLRQWPTQGSIGDPWAHNFPYYMYKIELAYCYPPAYGG